MTKFKINCEILYVEIKSLFNKYEYCYEKIYILMNYMRKIIGIWINHLIKMGYLSSEIIYYERTKNIKERKFYIITSVNEKIEDNNIYLRTNLLKKIRKL